ncbi:MAG TPA: hypothetical protein VF605_18970 [Allosphingosinicella sp.]
MPNAPLNGRSVAAMMRRGVSAAESRLIVTATGDDFGFGGRRGDEAPRR